MHTTLNLIALWLMLSATAAHADLLVVERIAHDERSEIVTLKLKGSWLRVDRATSEEPISSAIYDKKSGDVVLLFHGAAKSMMRVPAALTEKMKEQIAKAQSSAAGKAASTSADPKPRATGKKDSRQGFETEEFVVDGPEGAVTYAIAKSFPHASELLGDLDGLLLAGGQGVYPPLEFMPAFKSLPGFVMLAQSRTPLSGKPVTVSVERVSEATIPQSDFAVPADYKEDVGDETVRP